MANWKHHIHLKELFTDKEDYESVKKSMNEVADRIEKDNHFDSLDKKFIKKFRKIPKGDEFFKPIDYANKLLSTLYDFADYEKIWID